MSALRVVGWIFIPYIMIFVRWKQLRGSVKTIGIIWAGICALIALVSIVSTPSKQPAAPVIATQAPVQKSEPAAPDWKKSIEDIAVSSKSTTEKFDEVTKLARGYQPNDSELKEFESYIIGEYKNKKYLSDITNNSYMLTNIFKSTVIEKHYDDKEKKPIDSFALDFLQNTKYTYRGADKVDSDSVKSNEGQMNKALAQIK